MQSFLNSSQGRKSGQITNGSLGPEEPSFPEDLQGCSSRSIAKESLPGLKTTVPLKWKGQRSCDVSNRNREIKGGERLKVRLLLVGSAT